MARSHYFLAFMLSLAAGGAHSGGKLIAVEGTQVPGLAQGVVFGPSVGYTVDEAGRVAYKNVLRGQGVTFQTNSAAVFLDETLISRQGNQVPGLAIGVVFADVFEPNLSPNGRLTYNAALAGPGIGFNNAAASFLDGVLAVQTGSPAPGVPAGATISGFTVPVANTAGQMAYTGSISGSGIFPGNNEVVYRDQTLVARTGTPAPGLPAGTTLRFISGGVQINDVGQVAYIARVLKPGGSFTSYPVVYRDTTPFAVAGEPAPGLPAGVVVTDLHAPTINGQGQVAFRAFWTSPGGVQGATIYRDQTPIISTGDPAPALTGITITGFSSQFQAPQINDAGQIAYAADLGGTGVTFLDNQAVYRNHTLIARTGMSVPVLSPDRVVGRIGSFTGALLSANGFVAFRSGVSELSGVELGQAVWFGDGNELVDMIVPGDFIAGQRVLGVFDSAISTRLNQRGQAAFRVSLQGASGTMSALAVLAPNLYWRGAAVGEWGDAANWSFGFRPDDIYGVRILSEGSVTVLGPTADDTVNLLQIGGTAGRSTLELRAGAQLAVRNGPVQIKSGGVLTGVGRIASEVRNEGEVEIRNLAITGGLFNSGLVTGNGVLAADLRNTGTGRFHVGAGKSVALIGATHTNSGAGRIEVDGGALAIDGGLLNGLGATVVTNAGTLTTGGMLTNTGKVSARDSTLRFNAGLTNSGLFELGGAADVFGSVSNDSAGRIVVEPLATARFHGSVVNAGEIRSEFAAAVRYLGDVSGAGDFTGPGIVTFLAGMSPGTSPARITFEGDAIFEHASLLTIELGGLRRGDDYDAIDVAGTLDLRGGTLRVVLVDGFIPVVGNHFDILDWGVLQGTFGILELPDGIVWNLASLYATGEIAVAVPEPSQYTLMLAGVLLVAMFAHPSRCGGKRYRRAACPPARGG